MNRHLNRTAATAAIVAAVVFITLFGVACAKQEESGSVKQSGIVDMSGSELDQIRDDKQAKDQ